MPCKARQLAILGRYIGEASWILAFRPWSSKITVPIGLQRYPNFTLICGEWPRAPGSALAALPFRRASQHQNWIHICKHEGDPKPGRHEFGPPDTYSCLGNSRNLLPMDSDYQARSVLMSAVCYAVQKAPLRFVRQKAPRPAESNFRSKS